MEGRWITVKGNHILIKEGQTVEEALAERFGEETAKSMIGETNKTFDEEDEEINLELEDADKEIEHKREYKEYWIKKNEHSAYSVSKKEYERLIAEGKQGYIKDTDKFIPDGLEEKIQSVLDKATDYNTFDTFIRGNLYGGGISLYNYDVIINAFSDEIEAKRTELFNKEKDKVAKYLSKIPKLSDSSIDSSYKQANANGYVESLKYPYGSSERYAYTNNCQRCVIAYEMRRREFDVEAEKAIKRNDKIYNNDVSMSKAFLEKIKTKKYEYKDDATLERYSSRGALFNQVKKDMINEGEGARFIIGWQWKNMGYGHTINAEIKNGELKLYDAQIAVERDFDEYIKNNKDVRATTFDWTRVDNLTLSDDLEDIVKWKK